MSAFLLAKQDSRTVPLDHHGLTTAPRRGGRGERRGASHTLRSVPTPSIPSARSFAPEDLARAKREQGIDISVCIPARDEQSTIGDIVATVRRDLVETHEVVDEIVVMDDSSNDATSEAASVEGARVVPVRSVLPHLGVSHGKGNALWRSLFSCHGDVIVWVDADIRNFSSHFVTGLVAPLLEDPTVGFVKGCYRRPLGDEPHGGGRVTELMARPLLAKFFPDLAGIVQPLSGEYAMRRSVAEAVPFVEGWGVEIALLIDVAARFGVEAIAQVDLDVREHRNRPLEELSPQAYAILVTVLRRAGLDPERDSIASFARIGVDRSVERVAVNVGEHPPMVEIPEYVARHRHA